MEVINVVVAALAAFASGAVWYSTLGRVWVSASGVPTDADGNPSNASDPMTYATGLIAAIIVATMMRYLFAKAGIVSVTDSAVHGFLLGLFVSVPWLMTNYIFAARPKVLWIIDGGYAVLGCTAIGLVLGLF